MTLHAPSTRRSQLGDGLSMVGMGVALGAALLAAMVVHEPVPFFDVDPMTMPPAVAPGPAASSPMVEAIRASMAGIGPTVSLLLSIAAILASACVLAGEGLAGRGVSLIGVVLAGVGSVGALLHSLSPTSVSLEDLRIASAWIAAIWTGLAAWHAGRNRSVGRLTASLAISFVVVLALKAAGQVWIEHPMTLASFRDNKDAFFAARGWLPDSAAARAYERRLAHPDATGWFGLSNVMATFPAAALACLATLLAASFADRRTASRQTNARAARWLLALACAITASTLWLTHSKGGLVAAAVGAAAGLGAVSIASRSTVPPRWAAWCRSPRAGSFVAIAMTLGVLIVVAVRGLLGERLGELSLLFRWFYAQAAGRIFVESPLTGVGPAGFQRAYMLAKPALSPEEVTSPHSLFLDHAATLGVFGFAWIALVLWMIASAGRRLDLGRGDEADPSGSPADRPIAARTKAYWLALVAAIPIVVSLWLQRGASILGVLASGLSPADPAPAWALLGSIVVLTSAALAWIGLALLIDAQLRHAAIAWVAVAAMAITLAIHSQIEMTPIQPASAPLWFALLGSAASGTALARRKVDRTLWLIGPVVAVSLAASIAWVLPRIARWEARLASAARLLEPIGQLDLSPDQITEQGERALDDLAEAQQAIGEDDLPTRRIRVRLMIALASLLGQTDRDHAGALIDRAIQLARAGSHHQDADPGAWALLAGALESRAALTGHSNPELLDAWTRVHELNPAALAPVRRLAHWYQIQGDESQARRWAQRALELDENLRLDPIRRLSDKERRSLQRIVQTP